MNAPPIDTDVLLDLYGECTLGQCNCLKPGKPWIGRLCQHWRTWGCGTIDELIGMARKLRRDFQSMPTR